MKFKVQDFNEGEAAIAKNPQLTSLWNELIDAISSVTDDEIIEYFDSSKRRAKSISEAINHKLNERLIQKGWTPQSKIFKGDEFTGKTWTLDFSKSLQDESGKQIGIPIEVVFNHGEAIAWNLIKLSLASENNVRKQLDFDKAVGIYICATKKLKDLGGFDGAIGEYEKVLKYLNPLDQKMIKPIVIVGLKEPESFYIPRYPNNYSDVKLRGRSTGKIQVI
ncbi:Type-2 restriction enzyme BglII [Candidatus Nanopelagicaceae bacterium]